MSEGEIKVHKYIYCICILFCAREDLLVSILNNVLLLKYSILFSSTVTPVRKIRVTNAVEGCVVCCGVVTMCCSFFICIAIT